jgi:hypothetical protein
MMPGPGYAVEQNMRESEWRSLKDFERSDVFLTMEVALALLAERLGDDDSFDPPPSGGGSTLQT